MADKYRASNDAFYSDRPLVAAFFGGTSGIGEQAARALVSCYAKSKTSLRIYIVGRKDRAGKKIISECSEICPRAQFEFVKANDLTSIKDTDSTCEELIRVERTKYASERPRIDLLVLSQGQLDFGGRAETAEGLDRQFSLLYYSRICCITNLMPLLSASSSPHVISVFAGGLEGKLLRDDLSLRKPENFSVTQARSHTCYLTTMVFERLAREQPRLSLVHAFPGLVITPAFDDNDLPLWFKTAFFFLGPIAKRFIALPLDESGRRIISLGTSRYSARADQSKRSASDAKTGTDGTKSSGAYAVDQHGEPCKIKVDYAALRKDGFEDTAWQHTMKVFDDIRTTGRFE